MENANHTDNPIVDWLLTVWFAPGTTPAQRIALIGCLLLAGVATAKTYERMPLKYQRGAIGHMLTVLLFVVYFLGMASVIGAILYLTGSIPPSGG